MVCLFILSACSGTDEQEYVTVSTRLELDSSFEGSRTIVCRFPNSIVDPNSETGKMLDKVVEKYCPQSMKYTKNIKDGEIQYSFSLGFSSKQDYSEKVSAVSGLDAQISFSNPDTVLASGWKITENFDSHNLLSWMKTGADTEGFNESLDFETEDGNTTVVFNGESVNSDAKIFVNRMDGKPIQKIRIETVNNNNQTYTRKIIFTIPDSTYDELGEKLVSYFESTKPKIASAKWAEENNAHVYTVAMNDVTVKELEGYTNNILSTVSGDISYNSAENGITPLSEQREFSEDIDFSSFIGTSGKNVPIEYTYEINDSSDLDECLVNTDGIWKPTNNLLDENQYSKKVAISSNELSLSLKIPDGKKFICDSIDITLSGNGDKRTKTVVFRYETSKGGAEAATYAYNYFKALGAKAEEKAEGKYNICTVTIEGSIGEISTKCAEFFGSGNYMSQTEWTPSMSFRNSVKIEDNLRFAYMLTGGNADVPITYTVETGDTDTVSSLNATANGKTEHADLSKSERNRTSITLKSGDSDVVFEGTSANTGSIVTLCIITAIMFIIVGIIIAAICSQSNSRKALPAGEAHDALPGRKNTLMKRLSDGKNNKRNDNR